MENLRPCPFCGGKANLTKEDNYGFVDNEWYADCGNCGLLFGFAKQYSKEEAIEAWNRRTKLK